MKPQKKAMAVEQFTKAGTLIRTFESAVQAAEYIDGKADRIRTACKNNSFYKGYLWRYKNDLP